MAEMIYGRNPVLEALSSGAQVDRIVIQRGIEGSGKKVYAIAKRAGIPLQAVERQALDRIAGVTSHQGVVAYLAEFSYCEIDDIMVRAEISGTKSFVIALDGIEDPQNLGAIIRTADGAGAHGVLIPSHGSASVTGAVIKASAGAALHMAVARVGNLNAALDQLKARGLWVYGLDMDGENYRNVDYSGGAVLVVGSEGKGISRLVKERCDRIISIPMHGHISSLNASAAAAIAMYEIAAKNVS